jgi:hypothetical protein
MRYLVRERLFSIGNDSWVTDEQGDKVFLVDGKALRLRETFELRDASGAVLATIRKKVVALTDTLEIEHDGAVAATVRKALFSPLHHRANIEIPGPGGARGGREHHRQGLRDPGRAPGHRAGLPVLVPDQGHLRGGRGAGRERRADRLHRDLPGPHPRRHRATRLVRPSRVRRNARIWVDVPLVRF